MNYPEPFVSPQHQVAELSVRSIVLAILLTVLLAMSNAYLALKLGILTSASIPAAIISMGVLRLFKRSTILENNAVQTAASAGEAVAGGIVYTIPALIIIEYWHHFDYLTNFLIAACGGILGVLFSIPLRRTLVNDESLRFPEGRAIAEVLKSSTEKIGVRDIIYGSLIGAGLELLQVGFKVIASSWNYWLVVKRSIFGLGAGFSATMIGAGYLVGFDMACSIFLGAILAWLFAMPVASFFLPTFLHQQMVADAAMTLWNQQLRYLGIGAMLFAGIWTLFRLMKPLLKSMHLSSRALIAEQKEPKRLRTDRDIPFKLILLGIGIMIVVLWLFFQWLFPVTQMGLVGTPRLLVIGGAVGYVIIMGFLFAVITAYFSGMVGVTASPGSSVVIAGILFAAWLLLALITAVLPLPLSQSQIAAAEAIVIIIGSVVTGIAAIANDNSQDLKVGQLVGATPWKQQVMLLLGVIVSSMVIPPVMQLLFDVYGIGGVMPHAGMDISQSLPAPTAALLAAITKAVLAHSLPWLMMFLGALMIAVIMVLNRLFGIHRVWRLSILGVAIGLYLPLSSSFPLFIGGMIAYGIEKRLSRRTTQPREQQQREQIGTRIACGLVAGSALMDVFLAIPFSIFHSPNVWRLVNISWDNDGGVWLAIISTVVLAIWIERRICR